MRKHHLIVLLILSLATIGAGNLLRTYNVDKNDTQFFNTLQNVESTKEGSSLLIDVANEKEYDTKVKAVCARGNDTVVYRLRKKMA